MSGDMAPEANATQAAWLALREAVNADWAANERCADERTRRIYEAARRLYRRKGGMSVDAVIDLPVMAIHHPMKDGNGWAITGPFVPAWATMIQDAVDAFEAVGL